MTPPVPDNDSEDLSDEEIAKATPTVDTHDLSKQVGDFLLSRPGTQLEKHELRRRKPHLYWRVRLRDTAGEEHVLVFVADWLQQEKPHAH
jgi:hypothetical protein